jgi:acetyl esterase/lipase
VEEEPAVIHRLVADWEDAYANRVNIPHGESWPERWLQLAAAFRAELSAAGRARLDLPYGEQPRNQLDLFMPAETPKGLVVYIHGGYWVSFDKSSWSHLAHGALAHGFAVAMPSYTLCPEIRISGITLEVGAAIAMAAGMIDGPIFLTGHSAGGHLATRMISASSPLPAELQARIRNTVSISGVHDLRPMMRLALNANLKLDDAEASAESPVLLYPMEGVRLTCWVGAGERAEFIRQNALLANIWTGLGAMAATVEEADRHHFSVVEGLTDPGHQLTRTLLMV